MFCWLLLYFVCLFYYAIGLKYYVSLTVITFSGVAFGLFFYVFGCLLVWWFLVWWFGRFFLQQTYSALLVGLLHIRYLVALMILSFIVITFLIEGFQIVAGVNFSDRWISVFIALRSISLVFRSFFEKYSIR